MLMPRPAVLPPLLHCELGPPLKNKISSFVVIGKKSRRRQICVHNRCLVKQKILSEVMNLSFQDLMTFKASKSKYCVGRIGSKGKGETHSSRAKRVA